MTEAPNKTGLALIGGGKAGGASNLAALQFRAVDLGVDI